MVELAASQTGDKLKSPTSLNPQALRGGFHISANPILDPIPVAPLPRPSLSSHHDPLLYWSYWCQAPAHRDVDLDARTVPTAIFLESN